MAVYLLPGYLYFVSFLGILCCQGTCLVCLLVFLAISMSFLPFFGMLDGYGACFSYLSCLLFCPGFDLVLPGRLVLVFPPASLACVPLSHIVDPMPSPCYCG